MDLYREKSTNQIVKYEDIKREAIHLAKIYAGSCDMMSLDDYIDSYYEKVNIQDVYHTTTEYFFDNKIETFTIHGKKSDFDVVKETIGGYNHETGEEEVGIGAVVSVVDLSKSRDDILDVLKNSLDEHEFYRDTNDITVDIYTDEGDTNNLVDKMLLILSQVA